MKIDGKEKISILLNLLSERYHASHQMRERSLKFAIWILGFIIIAIPWLLFNRELLTPCVKLSLTALILIVGIFALWFLIAINTGFNKNKELMTKIEETLGCYEKGLFIDSKTLFPDDYKKNKKFSLTSHFITIYSLIGIALVITIFFIWFNPN